MAKLTILQTRFAENVKRKFADWQCRMSAMPICTPVLCRKEFSAADVAKQRITAHFAEPLARLVHRKLLPSQRSAGQAKLTQLNSYAQFYQRQLGIGDGKKTDAQRIAELEERRKQIDAKLATLSARQKVSNRKRDTRRKVIVGAAVLAHAERDHEFAARLRTVLTLAVMREGDRQAIADLLPSPVAP